ncbi:MAG: alkaline phosphatase family protein [Rikenellaceae bacterium]
MFLRTILTSLLMLSLSMGWAQKPRLVVNFIVSSFRSGDIERYSDNLTSGGFNTLTQEGLYYGKAEYNFSQSLAPSTLSTISTGAEPSMHGVVGTTWFDYSSNNRETLIEDGTIRNMPYNYDNIGFSANNLIAQTLSEALLEQSPESKSITIAINPVEAIVVAGNSGTVLWVDPVSSQWSTSTAFASELPEWVANFNLKSQPIFNRAFSSWSLSKQGADYVNSRYSDIDVSKYRNKKSLYRDSDKRLIDLNNSYNRIKYTPLGNTLVFEVAKVAIANMDIGKDNTTDIINLHLSSSGAITQLYGRESIEVEDMLYRLDGEIMEFINYTKAQVKGEEVLFTFTSDSGSSSSYDVNGANTAKSKRFNGVQAEVILNGFLTARHGEGEWVLGYENGSIYLNHNTIYQNGMSVADIQNEIATFMMHFDGVAYALTATSLQSSALGYGYGELVQRSFFARRSGDVLISLLPGWIEHGDNIRSRSGSLYRYDRDVPLIFYGCGIEPLRVNQRVDMIQFAPTLSSIMEIDSPTSNQGELLDELRK